MKKYFIIAILLLIIAGVILAIVFYWQNFRGIWPAIIKPDLDIKEVLDKKDKEKNKEGELPKKLSISIFAENLPGARVMAKDINGNLWVSQTSEGKISLLEIKDGKVINQNAVFRNLKKPHGLVFDPENPFMLYFAEENKISRTPVYSEAGLKKIIDLPSSGGGHFTRTIKFGPDGRLYVSIGSSCDTCLENDPRRAAIYSMDKDGSDFKQFAKGLRNAVFFTWSFVDARMWATEMGRDYLGDNLPPDEINIIEEGKNYGWPLCYGKNILDTNFHKNNHQHIRADCSEPFEMPSYIDIPAHSAPLGLAFIPEEGWPEDYWYNLLVAYHGSWNRNEPTGYKIVRFILDEKGNYLGIEDFIDIWRTSEGIAGRPVDILVEPGGIMYISDDKAGMIYKVIMDNDNN